MTYSTIGIIAAIVLVIINGDVLRKEKIDRENRTQGAYRRLLLCILVYYFTDILWGVLNQFSIIPLLYADTVAFFASIAVSILLWIYYVVLYLNERKLFDKLLVYFGIAFAVLQIVLIIVNFFTPVLFFFDDEGAYHAGIGRYISFAAQVAMYLSASVYATVVMIKTKGIKKKRYSAIASYGMTMALMLILQIFYALLPLYSIGLLIGTCLLHSFIIEDEKNEYRRELEDSLKREHEQKQEILTAKKLAYSDALTGVKSKHAHTEYASFLDAKIINGIASDFSVAVFDVNGLKSTNDTMGHDYGDRLLVDACGIICSYFRHSPVFRIGGDEFVAILEGLDFTDRFKITAEFNAAIDENLRTGKTCVAVGIADFDPETDREYKDVFDRADKEMYRRKQELKDRESV